MNIRMLSEGFGKIVILTRCASGFLEGGDRGRRRCEVGVINKGGIVPIPTPNMAIHCLEPPTSPNGVCPTPSRKTYSQLAPAPVIGLCSIVSKTPLSHLSRHPISQLANQPKAAATVGGFSRGCCWSGPATMAADPEIRRRPALCLIGRNTGASRPPATLCGPASRVDMPR